MFIPEKLATEIKNGYYDLFFFTFFYIFFNFVVGVTVKYFKAFR